MEYTTENNSITPSIGDKPLIQSRYSPNFDQKIFKAMFPLRVLDVIQSEFHNQVGYMEDELKRELSESERVIHDQSVKIAELKRTVAALKGGVA